MAGALGPVLRKGGHLLSGTTRDPEARKGPGGIPLLTVGELGPGTDWSRALAGADAVVHLAARVHMMKERGDVLSAHMRANADGTRHLAEQAVKSGVKRFVFMSTVKVMGETGAFTEADTPAPEDAYGKSKWAAEQALGEFAGGAMEIVVLRPPLVYGPGVKGNFLDLMDACAERRRLPLGGVDARRSMIYAGNLASAVVACLNRPAAAGRTYFVKDGPDPTIAGLVRQISATLDVQPRLFSLPPGLLKLAGALTGRREAIRRLTNDLTIDDSPIRRELEWTPPFEMSAGLKATADWYRNAGSS